MRLEKIWPRQLCLIEEKFLQSKRTLFPIEKRSPGGEPSGRIDSKRSVRDRGARPRSQNNPPPRDSENSALLHSILIRIAPPPSSLPLPISTSVFLIFPYPSCRYAFAAYLARFVPARLSVRSRTRWYKEHRAQPHIGKIAVAISPCIPVARKLRENARRERGKEREKVELRLRDGLVGRLAGTTTSRAHSLPLKKSSRP